MHPSSRTNMERVVQGYLRNDIKRVLDVGGRGLTNDRSYKSIIPHKEYRIADIEDGLGVTDVMPRPYSLPFEDEYFDLVVSGQTLEHVANPFRLVAEMKRVLKIRGKMVIIVPSAGPRHDKKDYWRFMDNAFEAIADECGLKIVANWITKDAPDERSRKWRDNVCVLQR